MFITPGGSQIGLRVMSRVESLPPSPLAEIGIRSAGSGRAAAVEVSTSNSALYREFYAFCCDVADRIQLDSEDVATALAETLRRWGSLLRKKELMPEERQIGLLGELWFLELLARARGWEFAGGAWRGSASEEHDFTLEKLDVEVKTTRAESRIHTIGSLTQLLPKKRRPLFVLSIQVTSTGKTETSISLPRIIGRTLTAATTAGGGTATLIRSQIERCGWEDEDAEHYIQEWELRSEPALIRVDGEFPAIVPGTLRSLGKARLNRIGRVAYDVRLDGLGVLHGTKGFSELIER